MIKKLVWLMALTLTGCGAASEEDEGPETGEISQAVPNNGGGGGYTCTVEQCNGNLNPFGHCTWSINGACVECTAGTHKGRCSGAGACVETNCPPPKKAP